MNRFATRGSANVTRVDDVAWEYAKKHLQDDQWSPQEISCCLERDSLPSMSHETIYQRILKDKQAGGTLYTHLRCKKKRRKRYGSNKSLRGCIPNRVDIDQCPVIVDSRERIGDWEGDTIIGSHDGGAVITSMLVLRQINFSPLVSHLQGIFKRSFSQKCSKYSSIPALFAKKIF